MATTLNERVIIQKRIWESSLTEKFLWNYETTKKAAVLKQEKMYMESKEKHHDRSVQMQELEQYMKELSQDVTEMISGELPEEKQLLKTKLTTLVSKIDQA